jgi:GntR family transcriptional regulator of vanillate catabolism
MIDRPRPLKVNQPMAGIREIRSSRPLTASERAYREVRRMIADGHMQPGQWVTKQAIARNLKMSATPLSHALHRLEQEGLIQIVPSWGARLRPMTVSQYEESMEERAVLEGLVARYCATRAAEHEINMLKPLADSLDERSTLLEGRQQPDPELQREVTQDDRLLHQSLSRLSRLTQVANDIDRLRLMAVTCRVGLPELKLERRVTHRELLAALLTRNPETAERAMRDHITLAGRAIVPLLRERYGDDLIASDQAPD